MALDQAADAVQARISHLSQIAVLRPKQGSIEPSNETMVSLQPAIDYTKRRRLAFRDFRASSVEVE